VDWKPEYGSYNACMNLALSRGIQFTNAGAQRNKKCTQNCCQNTEGKYCLVDLGIAERLTLK
jgi:hypothetical protein